MTIRDALLRARRRPRHLGAGSPTIYRGDGYEFVELREYVPGDDVRRIDWAATARSNELQTRVVLEDVALTLAAIVDASPSMRVGRRRPLLDAGREALECWFGAATGEDRCIRVEPHGVTPGALQRKARHALTHCNEQRVVRHRASAAHRAGRTAAGNGVTGDRGLVRPRPLARPRFSRSRLALRLHGARRARPVVRRAAAWRNRAHARSGRRQRPSVRRRARARGVCTRGTPARAHF